MFSKNDITLNIALTLLLLDLFYCLVNLPIGSKTIDCIYYCICIGKKTQIIHTKVFVTEFYLFLKSLLFSLFICIKRMGVFGSVLDGICFFSGLYQLFYQDYLNNYCFHVLGNPANWYSPKFYPMSIFAQVAYFTNNSGLSNFHDSPSVLVKNLLSKTSYLEKHCCNLVTVQQIEYFQNKLYINIKSGWNFSLYPRWDLLNCEHWIRVVLQNNVIENTKLIDFNRLLRTYRLANFSETLYYNSLVFDYVDYQLRVNTFQKVEIETIHSEFRYLKNIISRVENTLPHEIVRSSAPKVVSFFDEI